MPLHNDQVTLLMINNFILNRVVPHPEYNWQSQEYDFALLKLGEKVDFAKLSHVYPACWPSYEPEVTGTNVRGIMYRVDGVDVAHEMERN